MIHVSQFDNPFQPRDGKHTKLDAGINVWDMFSLLGVESFQHGVVITINNKQLPEDQWDNDLPDGSIIGVAPKVEGGLITLVVISVIAIAAIALALTYTVDIPEAPDGSTPDPMYSLSGHANQNRFGEPIEAAYGHVRSWPSLGAQSYNSTISNDAWQYSLYCLGHGHIEIDMVDDGDGGLRQDVRIEDTNIGDFEDIEIQVVPPGSSVTLFRDNVLTVGTVGGLVLYGPNEEDFQVYERIVNGPGTTTDRIELDLTLPRGLYRISKKNNVKSHTVNALFEYIEIDDDGNEIGTWQTLRNWNKTKATTTPLRYTIGLNVPLGRYKVRAQRTNDFNTSHTIGNDLVWDAMRAFLPNVGNYGNVTMMAMKARATSNLNDQSKRRVNVVFTRKLNWVGAQYVSEPVATRSLVSAFIDSFTANYGADLASTALDLESLAVLDAELEAEGVYFDWIFDSAAPVWDVAKTIARACRGMPIPDGSQVFIVRDKPRTVLQDLFNADNIIEGSFSYSIRLARHEDSDSIEMESVDPETWKREVVLCSLPGSPELQSEKITLIGVNDRDRAYQEGQNLISTQIKQNEEINFSTGAEGFNRTYGDFIRVEYDVFGLVDAVGGVLEAISADRLSVWLSLPVTFTDGETYKITITGKDGTPVTYYASEGATSTEVVLDQPLSSEVVINLNSEPPRFAFGREDIPPKDCVITHLSPSVDDVVDVTAIVYDASVYDYDDATAPPLEDSGNDTDDPALPVVTGVDLIQKGVGLYTVTWNPAVGATSYIIQTSDNPEEFDPFEGDDPLDAWETVGNTDAVSFDIATRAEYIYIRVAGINVGQGPWAYYEQLIAGATRLTESTASEQNSVRITHDGDTRITHEED